MFEALTQPHRPQGREWLHLLDDEVEPEIVEAEEPSLVVWSSLWPARHEDRIHFDIDPDGDFGTWLTWRLLTPEYEPEPEELGHLRYRLNYLINGDLRLSLG